MSGEGSSSRKDIRISESLLKEAQIIVLPYNLRSGMFYRWLNVFEYAANLLDISDHKMAEFFIRMINDDVFTSDFGLTRAELWLLTYDQLISKFHEFYSRPLQFCNVHRRRFVERYQYDKENLEDYIDSLMRIYNKCNYSGSEKIIVRKQIIKGVRNDIIREKLSCLRQIRYDEFLEIAQELERGHSPPRDR